MTKPKAINRKKLLNEYIRLYLLTTCKQDT